MPNRIKIMKQTVFEQMNGTYTQQGDYLIPCLTLHDEEKVEIDLWGQRHLRHLKQSHKVLYYNLLTSGKLNSHIAEMINRRTICSFSW